MSPIIWIKEPDVYKRQVSAAAFFEIVYIDKKRTGFHIGVEFGFSVHCSYKTSVIGNNNI